jgi:hypothetical protein
MAGMAVEPTIRLVLRDVSDSATLVRPLAVGDEGRDTGDDDDGGGDDDDGGGLTSDWLCRIRICALLTRFTALCSTCQARTTEGRGESMKGSHVAPSYLRRSNHTEQ